ncbi:MAG: WD40 repeat-like protein [Watsoniomyces obsoletus]|nr:MAG: WD40 repeat-like protein [Watsoniomyces obsoletus]
MEFFDFEGASSAPGLEENVLSTSSPARPLVQSPALESLQESAPPDQLNGLVSAPLATSTAPEHVTAGFTDFESWIPRTCIPPEPCQYCRVWRLHCIMLYEKGKSACSSCVALSRECSFSRPSMSSPQGTGSRRASFDGRQGVNEAFLPTISPMDGRGRSSQPGSSREESSVESRARKSRHRFSHEAVKVLKDWLARHASHPYPTDVEKDELKRVTGLKRSQIANWLANARRRGKVPSARAPSPGMGPSPTRPIEIASTGINNQATSIKDMNPMERWKHSPPEHEPASVSAIANAVAKATLPTTKDTSSSSSSWVERHLDSSEGSSRSQFQAPSMISSVETGRSSGSDFSFGSAFSHQSQQSFGSMEALKRKDRRRRRRSGMARTTGGGGGGGGATGESRPFQCTFCIDTFKTKYDWQRHEKSLHLSLEKWICAPHGGIRASEGQPVCVYCHAPNPTCEHLETHHHAQCQARPINERTFYRKDHLKQHLRLMHGCELDMGMVSWMSCVEQLKSRCGFCNAECQTWSNRVEHLAGHFRAGTRMSSWKGDWGFEPAIAELVENAVPPWLIDHERRTVNPFSASRLCNSSAGVENGQPPPVRSRCGPRIEDLPKEVLDQIHAQNYGSLDGNVCYEQLERVLGAWAKRLHASGVRLTDEDLQDEARRIVYMSPDPWNQTAADNPQWLDRFKRKHGLSPVREVSREEEDGHHHDQGCCGDEGGDGGGGVNDWKGHEWQQQQLPTTMDLDLNLNQDFSDFRI